MFKLSRSSKRFRQLASDLADVKDVKRSPAYLRLIKEFQTSKETLKKFYVRHDPETEPLAYTATLSPTSVFLFLTQGLYRNKKYNFRVEIPLNYPYDPPRVFCLSTIRHPNIARGSGMVCMDILALHWLPVYDVDTILNGLLNILMEPNFLEPLNPDYQFLGSESDDDELIGPLKRKSIQHGMMNINMNANEFQE